MPSPIKLLLLASFIPLIACAGPSAAPDEAPAQTAETSQDMTPKTSEQEPSEKVPDTATEAPSSQASARARIYEPLPDTYEDTLALTQGRELPLEDVAIEGAMATDLPEPGMYYIPSANMFPEKLVTPNVDFAQKDVLLAIEGAGSSLRKIVIASVIETHAEIIVGVKLTGPGAGCPVTKDLRPIIDAKSIPATEKPVRFQIADERQDCDS
ncbi:hypothetical protein FIV42_22720 [Persicimonas caeni]|uniref:Uncharacterized protein n=1 Tax=Persicimonas caeni TaxID=2292766 RepID=A0A4Y6PYW3_PERCE|nr:hypothetical protein [Persicimonas caeni]QDG53453.1 hypothetical protein FIV42_22720 [Persicimonas caeni]QED34674.1 hypothetical protein FRD00_22715 [Persicimonas caeni]